ncbi:MAG: hypothetical protein L6R37_006678 [Teloschistes peruensis]|nr:MAG: hypothetical protein L6R37_006678 [Teloschistes peruensis]
MFADYADLDITVQVGITIHGRHGGNGPPLLLLHGFPQNHLIWHGVADQLVESYTVIALDLRGYGASSKPPSDEQHKIYSKHVMAQDCVDVMSTLGHDKFYICAHDRGARVAHKLCVDHPQRVRRAILLDIAPTLVMYEMTDFAFAKAYYHWFFLIQNAPYPEKLIGADPEAFIGYGSGGRPRDALKFFGKECYESYLDGLKNPATVHAMCEDYRASASIDMEDHRKDDKSCRKIQCPLMVLWSKRGVIEKCFRPIEEWEKVSSSTVVGESLDCGHFIPEESPVVVLEKILEFLKD